MSFKDKINEMMEQAIYTALEEKKKMDPVGKADADIDNDGDVDDSDEYLHNRRKAIKKAMTKESHNLGELQVESAAKEELKDKIRKLQSRVAEISSDETTILDRERLERAKERLKKKQNELRYLENPGPWAVAHAEQERQRRREKERQRMHAQHASDEEERNARAISRRA